MGEGVVGQGPVRIDPTVDDLGHRVGDDDVDPLERRDDRLLGRRQARGQARQADVAATLRRGLVGGLAHDRQPALAARWRLLGVVGPAERAVRLVVRPAPRDVHPGVVEAVRQLSADGDGDDRQVCAVAHEAAEHGPGAHRVRLAERHADPRPRRVAQDVEQLASGDPVGGDPVEGRHR